jgi:HD-like signal output (HDOD) protein
VTDLTDIASFRDLKPSDLPSPPEAAIRVVRACSRGDVGNAELSRLAGSDPILTAELLRVANSSYFGVGHEIRSLTRAITVLGHLTLRNLALCLAVRESVRSAGAEAEAEAFWEDALVRGAGARLLAQAVRENPDEAFTAGILQDFGMHVMLNLDRARADAWSELRGLDPDARRGRERELFGTAHDDVIRLLAHAWELPPELARALSGHHQCDDEDAIDVSALARILYLADWTAAVFRAGDKGAAIRRYREVAERYFGLGEGKADELLAAVPPQVEAAAGALGVATPGGLDFARVLAEAELAPDDPGC